MQRQQEKEKELAGQVPVEAEKILKYMFKNCSKYLHPMQDSGKFLYRGIQENESADRSAFIGNSRDKRIPKDSDSKASEQFNHCLKELGIEALRSNSIFTTSDIEIGRAHV